MTGLAATAAVVLALGVGASGPPRMPDHVGLGVRYSEGVMGRVATNRGIPWHPHMAAYTFAKDSDMGRLWLHIKGPAGEADFLVVDMPHPRDRRNLIARDIIAEMDRASGALICGAAWDGRALDCPVQVWRLK